MKIYKCCPPSELENFTRNGWELKEILSHDKSVNTYHSAPAQVVNNNNNNSYSSTGSTVQVESPVIVREPMFLLWKDSDVESREIELQVKFEDLKKSFDAWRVEFDKVKRERDQYQDEADRRTSALNESAGVQQKLNEQKRKLEGDLAKVQKAIGDLKYFEIVGGPVPAK